jgi:hypothetical protein
VYRVELLHILTSGELVSRREIEIEDEHLTVPATCPDCRVRPPLAVPPGPGYAAALVYAHDVGCPRVLGVVGRKASH